MKPKTIVVPTDFSASAEAALGHATALAHEQGAKLLIVHVQPPPVTYTGEEFYSAVYEPSDAYLRETLERVRPSDMDVPYQHRLIVGDPATEIVNLAEREQAQLVVMGTHGRTGLGRLLMGSVAEAVV